MPGTADRPTMPAMAPPTATELVAACSSWVSGRVPARSARAQVVSTYGAQVIGVRPLSTMVATPKTATPSQPMITSGGRRARTARAITAVTTANVPATRSPARNSQENGWSRAASSLTYPLTWSSPGLSHGPITHST